MGLLTKIFIIVVFMVSLVALGIQATLYAHRADSDYKNKWIQEVQAHYQTIGLKNSEIAYFKMELENRKDFIQALQERIKNLARENAIHVNRIANLDRKYTEEIYTVNKLMADLEGATKNLEVQLVEVQAQAQKITDLRRRVARLILEKNISVQDLQYVKQELERVQKDLANLEKRHVNVIRDKQHLQDQLEQLERMGFDISFGPPQKAVDAKVMSYSSSAGVAIINQGKDHGVLLGMKFTIYRGERFVASAVVREVHRDWAAIEIRLKHLEPQVGDDASNHLIMSASRPKRGQ